MYYFLTHIKFRFSCLSFKKFFEKQVELHQDPGLKIEGSEFSAPTLQALFCNPTPHGAPNILSPLSSNVIFIRECGGMSTSTFLLDTLPSFTKHATPATNHLTRDDLHARSVGIYL
ncbi:hypothetical protein TNCV_3717551 [Trichonephila clavipes]|nr:hypothetical protein TNCV_3717551 [Trichonephila clavipes]